MFMFDLAVIGGGPGGYVAAEMAGKKGLKVVLFEEKELGGVCLNEGCIPTKALLYSAKTLDCARHADRYGVAVEGASPDFASMVKRKNKVVKKLSGGVRLKMRDAGVEVVPSRVSILGGSEGDFSLEAEGEKYSASRILVCAGSSAFIPPIPGLDYSSPVIMTSTEALSLEEIPQSVVIIGGGVIGMEFASLFNSLGSKVTVLEMLPKILGPIDGEVSYMLRKNYEKKGVEFHLGCRVKAIEGGDVLCEDPSGATFHCRAGKILLSVGRRANLTGYGLENLGVEVDKGIVVDERMRTSVPGVYAAGDVTGFSMLAHTAGREGEVAVNNICGISDSMSYKAIPGVVYTNPEVACVGLSEDLALQQGIDVRVFRLPMAYSGRFVAENELGEGICKIITFEDGTVAGAAMMGNPCSELIQTISLAIERGITVEELSRTVFPHPSVSEIIREVSHLGSL